MNGYSVLTPMITAVLLASTGLVVVDEAIEHGYTIPDISEKYWDYETQFLDENDLDKFTGKWTGEYFPDQMTIEYEDGTVDYCGNASFNTYVSENNVRGTAIVTWNNIPDEGVVKAHYEMRGELDTNGDTNGTFGISFELSMVLNDPSTVYSLLSKGYSVMPNASFTGNFGNNTADILVSVDENGAEGCGGYMVLEKEELPSSDSIIQNIPGVDPYVGLLTGEPFESESNPDEEAGETITQVGTITSVAGARQISKLRSKPRPGKELVNSKEIESIVKDDVPASEEVSLSDLLPEEPEAKELSDDNMPEFEEESNESIDDDLLELEEENDEMLDDDVKPEEKTWLDNAGKWFRGTTTKVKDFFVNLIPGTGSVGVGGAIEAGSNLKKGVDFRSSEDYVENDSLGNVRRFGIDNLMKMAGSKASMSATLGGVGAVVGTALGGPFGGIAGGVIGGVVGGFIG